MTVCMTCIVHRTSSRYCKFSKIFVQPSNDIDSMAKSWLYIWFSLCLDSYVDCLCPVEMCRDWKSIHAISTSWKDLDNWETRSTLTINKKLFYVRSVQEDSFFSRNIWSKSFATFLLFYEVHCQQKVQRIIAWDWSPSQDHYDEL